MAILIYVALDLSLPAMPGAFVFEPADSAEGAQVRARAAAEIVALPALARDPRLALFQPPLEGDERPAPVTAVERRARPIASRQSRALHDAVPSSEDPH
ncbi:MAG TPA: hypothetical protein VJX92_19305 [Methylomirabilota bacterium]|nr:hypothetical protein [Methylomirabilota bacterium]